MIHIHRRWRVLAGCTRPSARSDPTLKSHIPMTTCDLAKGKCKPCEGGVSPLTPDEITQLLKQLKGWHYANGVITRTYEFKNYYQTMAFVNAAAWISHREDH